MALIYPSERWDPGLPKDSNENVNTTLGTALAGENLTRNRMQVEEYLTPTAFTSLSTVNISSTPGLLNKVFIGMPSLPTTIIYDSNTPSGTELLRFHAGFPPGVYTFNEVFGTGLSVDTIKSGGGVLPYLVFMTS